MKPSTWPGWAWPIWAWLGLAYGLRPGQEHHWSRSRRTSTIWWSTDLIGTNLTKVTYDATGWLYHVRHFCCEIAAVKAACWTDDQPRSRYARDQSSAQLLKYVTWSDIFQVLTQYVTPNSPYWLAALPRLSMARCCGIRRLPQQPFSSDDEETQCTQTNPW